MLYRDLPSEIIDTGFVEGDVNGGSVVVAEGGSVEDPPASVVSNVHATVLVVLNSTGVDQQISCEFIKGL